MNSTKFTKGPWKIKEHDMGEFIYCSQGYPLALPCDRPEHNANSHLIAAAPDLYEALNELTDRYVNMVDSGYCGYWDPRKDEEIINARATLSKARGE